MILKVSIWERVLRLVFMIAPMLKKVDGIVFPFFGFFFSPGCAVGFVLGMGFEDKRTENVEGDFFPGLHGADEFVGLKLKGQGLRHVRS